MNNDNIFGDADNDLNSENEESSDTCDGIKEEEEFSESMQEEEYIVLVSKENRRFYISKTVGMQSEVLRAVFDRKVEYQETLSNEIHLKQFRSVVVEKLIDYLYLANNYKENPKQMPKFNIDPSILTELLVASDYLRV